MVAPQATGPAGEPDRHWFEDIADHVGPAYLRYSFTMGTEQEVGFLVDLLGLEPGMRVLDVGCGPGRHALALARRGIAELGVDISERFIEVVEAEGGTELLDRAWEDPANLPTIAEIRDPDAWIQRVGPTVAA